MDGLRSNSSRSRMQPLLKDWLERVVRLLIWYRPCAGNRGNSRRIRLFVPPGDHTAAMLARRQPSARFFPRLVQHPLLSGYESVVVSSNTTMVTVHDQHH